MTMAQPSARDGPPNGYQSRLSKTHLNNGFPSKMQDVNESTHARRDSGYESSSPPLKTFEHRKASSISLQMTSRPPVRRFYSNAETSIISQPTVRHKLSMSASRSSSRPTTSHRTQSSRSSIATSSHKASHPTTRRSSSFLLQPLPQAPLIRPSMTKRAASVGTIQVFDNPFLPHQIPASHTETAAAKPSATPIPTSIPKHLRSSSSPCPRSPFCCHQQPSYTNYVPATTIDWTLPSTRKQEYEEIDRRCRGLKGLWRKVAPKSWRRNQQIGFFDDTRGEKGDDSGSVRRFRVDIEDEDDGSSIYEKDENWEKYNQYGEKDMKPKLAIIGRRVKSG